MSTLSTSKHGPKIRGFVFIEKIGSGTYATVYKAFRQVNYVIIVLK